MKFRKLRMLQADDGAGNGGVANPVDQVHENVVTETKEVKEVVETAKEEVPAQSETPTAKEDNKVDITEYEKLKAEYEKLTNEIKEKSTLEETAKKLEKELAQLKNESESKASKVTEYEALMEEIVKSKLDKIPDQYKELVPDQLTVKEKLTWLEKAEKTGLMGQAGTPNIEIGKPFNPASQTETIDLNSVSPSRLMELAYGNKK